MEVVLHSQYVYLCNYLNVLWTVFDLDCRSSPSYRDLEFSQLSYGIQLVQPPKPCRPPVAYFLQEYILLKELDETFMIV